MKLVIDASVLLMAYFPDEDGHRQAQILMGDHSWGNVELLAPPLLRYEITNACLIASRRGRLPFEKAKEVAREILNLADLIAVEDPPFEGVLELSEKLGISAYDGVYLALAKKQRVPLVTGDRRLYNTVHERHFHKILWIGDYRSPQQTKTGI